MSVWVLENWVAIGFVTFNRVSNGDIGNGCELQANSRAVTIECLRQSFITKQ